MRFFPSFPSDFQRSDSRFIRMERDRIFKSKLHQHRCWSIWLKLEVKRRKEEGGRERIPGVYTSCKYPCQKNLSKTSRPSVGEANAAQTLFPCVVSSCTAEGVNITHPEARLLSPSCPLSLLALTLSIKRVGEGQRENGRKIEKRRLAAEEASGCLVVYAHAYHNVSSKKGGTNYVEILRCRCPLLSSPLLSGGGGQKRREREKEGGRERGREGEKEQRFSSARNAC